MPAGDEWKAYARSTDADHQYADNKQYTARITVTDDDGAATTSTLPVNVQNAAPTVMLPATVDAIDEDTLFQLDASFTDPGADRWTVAADYLGNGQFVPVANTGKTFRLARIYDTPGPFLLTVRVRDDDGGQGMASVNVVVNDVAEPQKPFVKTRSLR